ncbi:D-Aminoacylase [Mycobacterium tuberculosis]|nr:D-Aminoacylase [Mycobacterium tuberculosis]
MLPGYHADLVIFDAKTIKDRGTYEEPIQFPEGIEKVIINGALVVDGKEVVAAGQGDILVN